MCAIDIVDPHTGLGSNDRAGKALAVAREKGLLVMTASGNVLRTLMPLVINDEELERGLNILSDAIAATP